MQKTENTIPLFLKLQLHKTIFQIYPEYIYGSSQPVNELYIKHGYLSVGTRCKDHSIPRFEVHVTSRQKLHFQSVWNMHEQTIVSMYEQLRNNQKIGYRGKWYDHQLICNNIRFELWTSSIDTYGQVDGYCAG